MKEFKAQGKEGLVLQVPENSSEHDVVNSDNLLVYTTPKQPKGDDWIPVYLPEGNWEIAAIVHKDGRVKGDVKELIPFKVSPINEPSTFLSILESQGIYLNNPEGVKPREKVFMATKFETTIEFDRWQKAEENTLKEGNKFVVLIKQ